MTFHALAEYIKYCWQAKTRHGVHSPFVYQFIEECLRRNNNSLDNRIRQYVAPGDLIVLKNTDPSFWEEEFRSLYPGNEDVVLIEGIHKTKQHTESWNKLLQDQKLQLSIDIYFLGLLFVKREFKEKQHFILK